ncbi:hypothetical protein GCM10009838_17900 [Catenulispora subtropica]|uniref:Uncharacterized protein n=1 Tax=Catenulispora subtropica TaxID=450798 RepID=A0ABN2R145_9ACTN
MASAAFIANADSTLTYVSAVSTIEECPNWSETTFRSTPACSANDAAPWRRSCSRIGGNPCSAVSFTKRRYKYSEASGWPSALVNTNSDGTTLRSRHSAS